VTIRFGVAGSGWNEGDIPNVLSVLLLAHEPRVSLLLSPVALLLVRPYGFTWPGSQELALS
jgi:hypothetical protein